MRSGNRQAKKTRHHFYFSCDKKFLICKSYSNRIKTADNKKTAFGFAASGFVFVL
jgi:hypothetical protein